MRPRMYPMIVVAGVIGLFGVGCGDGDQEKPSEPSSAIEGRLAKFDYGPYQGGGRVLDDDAVAAVVKEGQAAIPTLLKGLSHEKYTVRWGCAKALAKLHATTPEVLAGLIRLIRDKEWLVRRAALEAFRELKVWNKDTMQAVAKLAVDTEPKQTARRMFHPPYLSSGVALTEDQYLEDNSERAIKTLATTGEIALPYLEAMKEDIPKDRLPQVEKAIEEAKAKKE